MSCFLRYLWAAPTTLIGLVLAGASLRRGHVAIVDGVIEAHGPFLQRALASLTPLAGGADAMTLGHVVIGRDARALELTRAHERVHVRQYEWWGPLFVPAYLLAGVWAVIQGGHPYFDNRFEREARLAEITDRSSFLSVQFLQVEPEVAANRRRAENNSCSRCSEK